jgi:uncharacterized protein RhaS with RHS repeats
MKSYRSSILMLILSITGFYLHAQITNFTETYTYDAAARLVRVDYSNEASISYTYDPSGNLIQIESVEGTVAVEEPGSTSWQLGLTIYPNPVSSQTTIQYSLDRPSEIEVTMYDAVGRVVKVIDRGVRDPGLQSLVWNGRSSSGTKTLPGVYVCQVKSNRAVQSKTMIVTE